MTLELVCKAFLLGILNAAPVGPVGLLCLRTQMGGDRISGLLAALGMAVAYAIIAFCVLIGLKSIGRFLEDYRVICQIGLGAMLVVIGGRAILRKADRGCEAPERSGRLGQFAGTFVMTLFNPVPFATFAVILATLRVAGSEFDLLTDCWFAFCVLGGTMGFWWILGVAIHRLRRRRESFPVDRLSLAASIALLVFGMVIFSSAFAAID